MATFFFQFYFNNFLFFFSIYSNNSQQLYSNQLKVYNGDDGRGLRDITLPTAAPEPGTPLSAQAVDEASGVVDVTRSLQRSSLAARRATSASEVRLDEKVLHCAWHPVNNTIAVAGHAGLCLYKV